jgi:hypothetical protein
MTTFTQPSLTHREVADFRWALEAAYIHALTLDLRMTLEANFPDIDSFAFTVIDVEQFDLKLEWAKRADGTTIFNSSYNRSESHRTDKLEAIILYLVWRILQQTPLTWRARIQGLITIKMSELHAGDHLPESGMWEQWRLERNA